MQTMPPAAPVSRMTKADAVMSVAVAAAAADGRLRPAEVERLRLMAHISPLFRGVHEVDGYLESVARDLRRLGERRLLETAAASLDLPLKEAAYAWAAEIVRADLSVHNREVAFLEDLRRVLGIHRVLASKIRAVVAIRARGA